MTTRNILILFGTALVIGSISCGLFQGSSQENDIEENAESTFILENTVEISSTLDIVAQTEAIFEISTEERIREPTQEPTHEPSPVPTDIYYISESGEQLSTYHLSVRELSPDSPWAHQFRYGYLSSIVIPDEKNFKLEVAYVAGGEYLGIRLRVLYTDRGGEEREIWLPLIHIAFDSFDPDYKETIRNMGEPENVVMDDLMEITESRPLITVNQSLSVDHIADRPVKLSDAGGQKLTIEEFVNLLGSRPRNVLVEGLFYIAGEIENRGEKIFQIGMEHGGVFDSLLPENWVEDLPNELQILPTASGFFIAPLD